MEGNPDLSGARAILLRPRAEKSASSATAGNNTMKNPMTKSELSIRPAVLRCAILGLTLLAGCHDARRAEPEDRGPQRWNHIRARVKVQLADQQYEAGLFQDAIKTLTESLALDAAASDSYVLLARAHLELGETAAAAAAVDAARGAGLESADLDYTHAVILEQRNQLEDAAKYYANAHRLSPTNTDYLVAYAECLVALERPLEALNLLMDSRIPSTQDGRVEALSGHIAAMIGDIETALGQYRLALSADGENSLVSEELGRMLVRVGRCDEALVLLRPLADQLTDASTGGSIRRDVATCYLRLSDPLSAKAVLIDYTRANPGDGSAQMLLAKAAIAANDWMTALRAVALAEQKVPGHPDLRLIRATVRWKRGDLTAAASDLEGILNVAPNDVEARCLLAEVYRAQRRTDEAWNQFHQALTLDPLSAWASAGLQALSDN